jgi:co-chaperonin GroES (HSP10)
MDRIKRAAAWMLISGGLLVTIAVATSFAAAFAEQATGTQVSAARALGTVKTISGHAIVLAADSGTESAVQVQESARVLRIAPGQKDLKDATPVQLSDIQVGDRILVRGTPGQDGKSILASTVVLMKNADIAEKQQRDRQDWDKRGLGGLVTSVDCSAGVITLSTGTPAKNVKIRISKSTVIRHYAPTSIKFDDAVRATLDQIKPGDQVRARGNRSEDGAELKAEEIVAGSFRNIAGTVNAIDSSKQKMIVTDLATKQPVLISFTAGSQMHQLPQTFAQRLAMRLKAPAGPGVANNAASQPQVMPQDGSRGQHPGGATDVQQMLSHMPAVTLADLKKGDAVMIVTTQPQAFGEITAITLLSGVEPILAASPNDNRAAMLLSPWNLGSGGAESE